VRKFQTVEKRKVEVSFLGRKKKRRRKNLEKGLLGAVISAKLDWQKENSKGFQTRKNGERRELETGKNASAGMGLHGPHKKV